MFLEDGILSFYNKAREKFLALPRSDFLLPTIYSGETVLPKHGSLCKLKESPKEQGNVILVQSILTCPDIKKN